MKRRSASCPSCGGPMQFSIGSMVSVCDFCHSAIARTDKAVEDYGKVADLVETSSPLRRGLSGSFNEKRFTIAGHVQYRHPAGGVWDEWYLAFPGGKWGWLAEAQGKTYLMFQRKLSSRIKLPEFEELDIGKVVRLGDSEFTVMERGTAKALAAEGEIPWPFRSGQDHRFADLQGEGGVFATFEYDREACAYVGKEIALDSLSLEGQGWDLPEETIAVEAANVNCPNCGGPLTLRTPDQTLRVTCQSCNSLLDVDQGKLTYLKTLKTKEEIHTKLPLGKEGTLFGDKYTVIGFLRRYATYAGTVYPWDEYLLYEPKIGFRWLVCNDRHWSFVGPTREQIKRSPLIVKILRYKGEDFRLFDRGVAHVRHVLGEFYWKVEAGEKVRTADFIAPPKMLSFEWSDTENSEEMIASEGVYVPTETIEKAFGLKDLPRSFGVGAIQPGPWFGWGVFGLWPVFAVVIMVTYLVFAKSGRVGADPWLCFYGLLLVSGVPAAIIGWRAAFEMKRWENSDYNPYSSD